MLSQIAGFLVLVGFVLFFAWLAGKLEDKDINHDDFDGWR